MKKNLFSFFFFLALVTSLQAQDWEEVAGLPSGAADARHHPVTFSIGGYGYVMGGAVNWTAARDFMRYDAFTNTWESLPSFPGPARAYSYGTSRDTKAYVGFGLDSNDEVLNDFWEYDSETELWKELSSCPCLGRLHPAFVQLDGKIFVGMGNGDFGNYRDWWEYDIATDTWTERDELPGLSRHHPFYFGIGDIAYVGFGHGNNVSGNLQIFNDFYAYDPATEQWTQLNDFPGEARVAGTQFDLNGKGYILSGDGDDHSFMPSGELWEYDPELDEWTELQNHPGSSRWAPGSFVINGFAYLTGGLSTAQLESDLWRFDLNPLPPSNTNEITGTPIVISPNPTSTDFSFTEDITQFTAIRLVDGFGRTVKTVTTNIVNVSDLPAGIYHLQFFKDEKMQSEKIMVK